MPRADETRRPPVASWAQPRGHGGGAARALDRHVDRVVDEATGLGHRRDVELVGLHHVGGADGAGQVPPGVVRLADHDLLDAAGPQRATTSRPIGPPPETRTR